MSEKHLNVCAPLRRSLRPVSFPTRAATKDCPTPKAVVLFVCRVSPPVRTASDGQGSGVEVNVRLTHRSPGYEELYISSEGGGSIREGGLTAQSRSRYVPPPTGYALRQGRHRVHMQDWFEPL